MDHALLTRAGAWPLRTVWLVVPFLMGPALADALDSTDRPVQLVASAGLWLGWAVGLAASLLPTTVSLTVARTLVPAGLGAMVAALPGREGGPDGWAVVGVGWSLVVVLVAFLPHTGAAFINGSSYGNELRQPLRVPTVLLAGPIPLAWAAVAAGLVTGPLLLAAGQWVGGGIAVIVGLPAAWWGGQVLHSLARRWTVFVPGGLVLHDAFTLADPVLFRKTVLAELGPAPATTASVDLTGGAPGLAVEARFTGPVTLVMRPPARSGRRKAGAEAETVEAEAVIFTPTQPGAFLAAARERRLGDRPGQ